MLGHLGVLLGNWPMTSCYLVHCACTLYMYNIIAVAQVTSLTHRSSDNPAQGVPGSAVKPVEKGVEAIHSHVVGGAIVEPETESNNNHNDTCTSCIGGVFHHHDIKFCTLHKIYTHAGLHVHTQ